MPVIRAAGPDLAVAQACQEGDDLNGLPKPHLVSQNASRLLAVQFPEPADPGLLVPGDTAAPSGSIQASDSRQHPRLWLITPSRTQKSELCLCTINQPAL